MKSSVFRAMHSSTKCTLWLLHNKRFPMLCRKLSYIQNNEKKPEKGRLSSQDIRELFLNYFRKHEHTEVRSSPVFLNSDPSLLFVNAGMNQFKSVLLNKTLPSHPFHELKRAVSSQKCIRITGKHNDLDAVGRDGYHHTYFEMLGNWSFGDYFKKEACLMAWELLTKVYGLNAERLYVTYFGGDEKLNIQPDEECKNIWLDIGVPEDRIYPFGTADNFWDMGEIGPCGPCTEIHYDYMSHQPTSHFGLPPAPERINKNRPDLIEVWNLVFIQYKREKDQTLHNLSKYHVDTGMGLERLTAVLQGTKSNYDTDIFFPIMKAIEKNFKVRPYAGRFGNDDIDEIDTAYRILADHTRMLTVAIADGLFPDNYDSGHILQKIIRRSAYIANCVMKTRPGVLSSLIPYVAETLAFHEVDKHVKEIEKIVNEEEKILHNAINRARKARNKMASEAKNGILSGKQVWELTKSYGLEDMIIQDLASETNLILDWEDYRKICKNQVKPSYKRAFEGEDENLSSQVKDLFHNSAFPQTDDSYKYHISLKRNSLNVEPITSQILVILADDCYLQKAESGQKCLIVTDKTNFYATAGGQICDKGEILGDDFIFEVKGVYSYAGYVFHDGVVQKGVIKPNVKVEMFVDQEHRQRCTRNHSATHLLNAALKTIFPFTAQRSSYVGPNYLKFGFSSREPLTEEQIEQIEKFVNDAIRKNLCVSRTEIPFHELAAKLNVILMRGEEYPENVFAVTIGENLTVEPCCGTHVQNTSEIGQFVIVPNKAHSGSIRYVKAVTGNDAVLTCKNGEALEQRISELENRIHCLMSTKTTSHTDLQALLKEVKQQLFECKQKTDIQLTSVKRFEQMLKELKLELVNASGDFLENNADREKRGFMKMHKEPNINFNIVKFLQSQSMPPTVDKYKYDYYFRDGKCCIESISSNIISIIENDAIVSEIDEGYHCSILTNKTNFFPESCGQVGDKGSIYGKDFVFQVENVYSASGYVFHDGWVQQGKITSKSQVQMLVDKFHRQRCSANHTAVHLLQSALKKILPYAFQRFTFVDSSCLQLDFSSKTSISLNDVGILENMLNDAVQKKMKVSRFQVLSSQVKEVPNICITPGETFPEQQTVVSIGQDDPCSNLISVEPCCGTHVNNTSDIGQFVIVSSKVIKMSERSIRAVTGNVAKTVLLNGEQYSQRVMELQENVKKSLESKELNHLELWDYLKEVKRLKGTHETDLPVKLFREHQEQLSEYVSKLTDATQEFVQAGFKKAKEEIAEVLQKHHEDRYIVHQMSSVGDGKKIINLALSYVTNKPVMLFVTEGCNTTICTCTVPKELVSSTFSALLWINPVATILRAKARALSKDPELCYSVISSDVHRIGEAIDIANKFVNKQINK